jgi:hypothetical protein
MVSGGLKFESKDAGIGSFSIGETREPHALQMALMAAPCI